MRSDMGEGGSAQEELDRQRAALKLQSLARGRQQRKATRAKKEDYDKNPDKKPKGYKQYSEYDGEGKDNPYYVKLNNKKKKKKVDTSLYTDQHAKAATKIQSAQRAKLGRRKMNAKKTDPDAKSKGAQLKEADAEAYEAKLMAGKKGAAAEEGA